MQRKIDLVEYAQKLEFCTTLSCTNLVQMRVKVALVIGLVGQAIRSEYGMRLAMAAFASSMVRKPKFAVLVPGRIRQA
jgi:hypothetical protein